MHELLAVATLYAGLTVPATGPTVSRPTGATASPAARLRLFVPPRLPASPTGRSSLEPVLQLDAPAAPAVRRGCGFCGAGLPDARVANHLRLGADSFGDRLRLYLKLDPTRAVARELQFSVDVSQSAGLIGFGSNF